MQTPTRRRLLGYAAAGAALAFTGGLAVTGPGGRTRIVVVGGGTAGAAAALALRAARPDDPVLLVERDPRQFAAGPAAAFDRPVAGPGLAALRGAGVEVVLDEVVDLDWTAARLGLFSGRSLAFDRLLLAPGTQAVEAPLPGLDAVARHDWPAAWGSPREARRLRAQLAALPEAGHVVLRLPKVLSHPEAALGRALGLAGYLDRTRPRARLTVLDGASGPELGDRFRTLAAQQGIRIPAEWRAGPEGGTVLGVDAPRGTLETTAGWLRADVVNFVPQQGAGRIAQVAGLVDNSAWCPTDARGRSTRRPGTVILGDARKGVGRTVAEARLSARTAPLGLDVA